MHIKQKYQTTLSLNGLYKKVNWNFNTSYSDIDSENGNDRIITDILNNAKVNIKDLIKSNKIIESEE